MLRSLRAIFLPLLLTSSFAAAQAGYKIEPHTPGVVAAREVVRRYCQLDFDGARLHDATWSRIKPLTAWNVNPEFPAVKVVSFYQLTNAEQAGRTVSVEVLYTVLGEFQPGLGYTPAPVTETVLFEVRQSGDGWKIERIEPAMLPHVSRTRALAWIREQLAAEKDPVTKAALERAAADLDKKK